MRVQNVGVAGDESPQVGVGIFESARRQLHDPGRLRDFRSGLREDRDAMAQRREPARQRNDDALRAAVAFNREPVMGRDYDVHQRPSITSLPPS